MAFKEYSSYDGLGLADLVRKKQVSARELLDEARVRRVTDQQAREFLNLKARHGNFAGILYPRVHPAPRTSSRTEFEETRRRSMAASPQTNI